MEKIETGFEGLYLIQGKVFEDNRGLFLKTFNKSAFEELGLETDYKERYYSKSHKNVIRGMHFQIPPFAHVKIVNVIQGAVLDAVVDIRHKSPTFRKYYTVVLSENDGRFLYIPKGFAHGFKSLKDDTIVEYNQTTEYNNDCDCGIKWDSLGFDWELDNPVMSERDMSFPMLNDYLSPF